MLVLLALKDAVFDLTYLLGGEVGLLMLHLLDLSGRHVAILGCSGIVE
jgi:hypothetical protein